MTLITASEDLTTNTLSALSGLLTKLEYLSALREKGRYAHWGLIRVYGEVAATHALADAHAMVSAEVLRTPLSQLLRDTEAGCQVKKRELAEFLAVLSQQESALLPDQPSGGSTRHFNSVLQALSSLVRTQANATHPIA
jgi:hypothetical protein